MNCNHGKPKMIPCSICIDELAKEIAADTTGRFTYSEGDRFENTLGEWVEVVDVGPEDITFKCSWVAARVRCDHVKFEYTVERITEH